MNRATRKIGVRHVVGFLALATACMALMAAPASAEDNPPGISVTGVGTIKAKPSEVVIEGTVTGEGELANDANVKFRDIKKKAVASIEGLKNPNLKIDSGGSTVAQASDPQAQQRVMNGMSADTAKIRVQVSEHIRMTLKDVDKLEGDKLYEAVLKIIDACRDTGLQIGPPPATNWYEIQARAQSGTGDTLVQFKIPDTSSLQDEAYKAAIADAKAKAQKLADLSGVKLGRVISVHDHGASEAPVFNPYYGVTANNADKPVNKEASSATFGEIPVTVKVDVQFEIEK